MPCALVSIFSTPTLLPNIQCALSKHGQRLLSSLHASDPTKKDSLIRKFVASSSKSVSLNALSHLLSTDSPSFALPMYRRITDMPWFKWNPKIAADIISLLEKHGLFLESQALISQSISDLNHQQLFLFYTSLLESYSKRGLKQQVFDSYSQLKQIPGKSSSMRRRSYASMINGLCLLDLPLDAEQLLDEMTEVGFRPSAFEFRLVILQFGRLGLFSDIGRIIHKMEDFGCVLDTISANSILLSYGIHGKLSEMHSWIRKMRDLKIAFSVRTYNSILNSCPTIMSLVENPRTAPLSINGLFGKLDKVEILLVQELMKSPVLAEALEWSSSEGKLDLHGFHRSSAYLILLQWVEKLRVRFCCGEALLPTEILVLCGSAKHSSVRGQSPVKGLVSEMLFRMNSPLRIDKKNGGRFVARGKVVKEWLQRF